LILTKLKTLKKKEEVMIIRLAQKILDLARDFYTRCHPDLVNELEPHYILAVASMAPFNASLVARMFELARTFPECLDFVKILLDIGNLLDDKELEELVKEVLNV